MHHSASTLLRALVVLSVLSATAGTAAELGPLVGAKFPHTLAAPDQSAKQQTLESLMGEKGVAIFFVRSADWCPFCMGQLVDANRHFAGFQALGLSVVSVSVDEVAEIAKFAAAQKIEYSMLADPDGAINLSLGIRDEQYPVGTAAFGVPRPTLYVLDKAGTIRLRYMEPTYRTRPDLDGVLRDVAALGL
jgi:peroxiredoxin